MPHNNPEYLRHYCRSWLKAVVEPTHTRSLEEIAECVGRDYPESAGELRIAAKHLKELYEDLEPDAERATPLEEEEKNREAARKTGPATGLDEQAERRLMVLEFCSKYLRHVTAAGLTDEEGKNNGTSL